MSTQLNATPSRITPKHLRSGKRFNWSGAEERKKLIESNLKKLEKKLLLLACTVV